MRALVVLVCLAALVAAEGGTQSPGTCDAEWATYFQRWQEAFGAWQTDVCQACPNAECTGRSALQDRPEDQPTSIFDHLSPQELVSVRAFLLDQGQSGLSLEDEPEDVASNRIILIELEVPKKSEAVAYLDAPDSAPRPERRAKAVLYMGAEEPPFVGFYSVGPIVNGVVAPGASAVLVSQAEWFQRAPDTVEYNYIENVVGSEMAKLNDLTLFTFDAIYNTDDCPSDRVGPCNGLTWTDTAPRGKDSSQRQTWLFFMIDFEGYYLLNTGLEFLIEHSSMDGSEYYLKKVFFRGRSFDTVEALLAEWNADETYREHLDYDLNNEPPWSSLRRRGSARAHDDKKAPKQQQIDGARYTVTGQTVEWMGWQFHLGNNFECGARLFDIRFKNERIAYEAGLTEAASAYSSISSPSQANTFYLDSAWGLGSAMYELIPGLDCPEHATFLDLYLVSEGALERRRRAVCIFEEDVGKPIIKHFDNDFEGSFVFAGGARATRLVVRSSVSVYNYDYSQNWIFEFDGTFTFVNSASGYMQAGHWYPTEDPHGTRIHDHVMGSLHDHFVGVKLDLDIAGRKNSFQVGKIETAKAMIPHLGEEREQTIIRRSILKTEDESRLQANPATPATWIVINPNSTNKWGDNRGYKVVLGNPTRSILSADNPLVRGCSWIRDNIGITRHKDSEQRNSHGYNQAILSDPYLSYDSFFDGESIENEDIVLWVTIGTIHVPSAEDSPNSLISAGEMSVSVRPASFFDESTVTESRNSIMLTPDGVVYNGLEGKACAVAPRPLDYDGTTAVDAE